MAIVYIALIVLVVFAACYAVVAILDIREAKKRNEKYSLKKCIIPAILLTPAVILAFLFVLLPIIYSLGYGFTNFYLLKPENITFAGFKNFIAVFEDLFNVNSELFIAIKNTFIFVVLVVPLQIGLALGLALFCNAKIVGSSIFKVCFFVPVVVSLAVTSYLWLEILSPAEDGLMNSLFGLFGIPAQDFLNDPAHPEKTMIWIVIISAWQGCGYQMLIFLSALTGIRKDLYEAARMDGCNAWKRFLHITIPGLKPTLLYILITVFIGACRIMVQPMLMVGYQDNAITLSYYMYYKGFEEKNVGESSAIALFMTCFIGCITLLQRKFLGEKK